jgi:hypothetical protein
MAKFNKKLPPLLIAGGAVFLFATAYKFVFGKKSSTAALAPVTETAEAPPVEQVSLGVDHTPETKDGSS